VSTLISPPDDEPVSLATFKSHGAITGSVIPNAVLELRLKAAREWVEKYTGRALMPQTWRDTFDAVPYAADAILLRKMPVLSVTAITSYNIANVGAVYSSASYFVDTTQEPARIVLNDGYSWPSDVRYTNALTVEYIAGYVDEDAVPATLKHAIMVLASEWYERVEASTDERIAAVPFGLYAMLDPYRTMVD
jgi:uncharacterized phiE125 gp8 family phage protein